MFWKIWKSSAWGRAKFNRNKQHRASDEASVDQAIASLCSDCHAVYTGARGAGSLAIMCAAEVDEFRSEFDFWPSRLPSLLLFPEALKSIEPQLQGDCGKISATVFFTTRKGRETCLKAVFDPPFELLFSAEAGFERFRPVW